MSSNLSELPLQSPRNDLERLPLELLVDVLERIPVGSLYNMVSTCNFLGTVTTKILYRAITIPFAPPSMHRMKDLTKTALDKRLSSTQELQIGILYEDCPPRRLRDEEWGLLLKLLDKMKDLRRFMYVSMERWKTLKSLSNLFR